MAIERLAKKILLVGWDAADWKVISPLLDAGKLPALNSLVERGVMGNIATLQPCLSPILWTSIATGKFADKHGILGFVEPDGTGAIRLSSSTTRKTKAFWNILSQNGLKTNVIGWFASHPAEAINGVCVSNLFDQNPTAPGQDWPLPAESVHPTKWREPIKDLRMHPAEVIASDMSAFIPRIGEIDLRHDRRPLELARSLAHCTSVHSIATAVMENEPWDFMAIYYDMLDVAGHIFMPYHPPRMEHVPPRDFELYGDVMNRLYQFHDQMLARLLQLAGDDTTVIVVSDHGFHSGHRRPKTLTAGDSEEALAASWHRSFGIVCMAGPHIRKDERIYGMTLLDVAPTVLTLLGVPIGRDMDGKPQVQALDCLVQLVPIDSWDAVPGDAGVHPPETRIDSVAAQASIERLIALGYLEPSAAVPGSAVRVAMDEVRFNLAVVYLNSFRPALAVPLLQELCAEQPEQKRYSLTLAQALSQAQRFEESLRLVEDLEKRGMTHPDLDVVYASALVRRGDTPGALQRLARAEREAPDSLPTHILIGNIYITQRRFADAERAYERALAIDPESAHAHDGICRTLLERGNWNAAATHALDALSAAYQFPTAHYHLGVALEGLGELPRAVDALETAVEMAPNFIEAHERLAGILLKLGDPVRAFRLKTEAENLIAKKNDRLQ